MEFRICHGKKLYEELLAEVQLAGKQVFENIFIRNSSTYNIKETLVFAESLLSKSEDDIRKELVAFANEHE